jgi:valyl-tRNA synthetase
VSESEVGACAECGKPARQDEDVLDTWFSSALWPISTMGWPDDTEDLRAFYPTSVLITGFNILFFWVARMIMMGCHFTGKAPFADVHLTGLVRDARGQKMSKTRGNVMDPLDLVHQYGADAVRFTLAALASPGRDLPLDVKRMEGYRAFGTKLWNAARFVQMNLAGDETPLAALDPARLALPERWILAELERTVTAVNRSLEAYRFDEACRELYQFVWNDFCDWYLEMAKPAFAGESGGGRAPADVRSVARSVLLEALTLLHPVMPFITEEIAAHLGAAGMLIAARYPEVDGRFRDEQALDALAAFQAVVQEVRSYRHMVGLPPATRLGLQLIGLQEPLLSALRALAPEAVRLANLGVLEVNPDAVPSSAIRDVAGGVEIAIVLPEGALGKAEASRLETERRKLGEELERLRARLADQGFAARAPEEVLAAARDRAEEVERKAALIAGTLGTLA